MSKDLVVVLAAAAMIPLLLALLPRLHVPSELVEIAAGVVLGPSALDLVHPDEVIRALAVFGLSFLLFLNGFEVDVRRFRGTTGRRVLLTVTGSLVLAAAAGVACGVVGVQGAALVAMALLATWTGPVGRTLADAGVAARPVGSLTMACASAGAMAGVVTLSVGVAGSPTPLWGRIALLGILVVLLVVVGLVVLGAERVGRVDVVVARLADTSAQIRVRLTVLLVAAVALAALGLGFEAVLGAFLAGVLVRTLDPEPEVSHPHYPLKLDAVGFGLLIPVFYVTAGMTLDVKGLAQDPRALTAVPVLVVALLVVRGLPTIALRRDLCTTEMRAAGLLLATSLPFLLTVTQVGVRMQLMQRTTAGALITAGVISVLVFPPLAQRLLTPTARDPSGRSPL